MSNPRSSEDWTLFKTRKCKCKYLGVPSPHPSPPPPPTRGTWILRASAYFTTNTQHLVILITEISTCDNLILWEIQRSEANTRAFVYVCSFLLKNNKVHSTTDGFLYFLLDPVPTSIQPYSKYFRMTWGYSGMGPRKSNWPERNYDNFRNLELA